MSAGWSAPYLAKFAFTVPVKRFLASLDGDSYDRAMEAVEFAERLLPHALSFFETQLSLLFAHKNFLLWARYFKARERFVVVAMADYELNPLPPDGTGASAPTIAETVAHDLIGVPAEALVLASRNSQRRLSREHLLVARVDAGAVVVSEAAPLLSVTDSALMQNRRNSCALGIGKNSDSLRLLKPALPKGSESSLDGGRVLSKEIWISVKEMKRTLSGQRSDLASAELKAIWRTALRGQTAVRVSLISAVLSKWNARLADILPPGSLDVVETGYRCTAPESRSLGHDRSPLSKRRRYDS